MRLGFTGHEHDDEVGLIKMKGRLYDAEIGRFISADPHIQFVTDTTI
jgi:RHS repeat-associated protein